LCFFYCRKSFIHCYKYGSERVVVTDKAWYNIIQINILFICSDARNFIENEEKKRDSGLCYVSLDIMESVCFKQFNNVNRAEMAAFFISCFGQLHPSDGRVLSVKIIDGKL